jgi:hypothetical protein
MDLYCAFSPQNKPVGANTIRPKQPPLPDRLRANGIRPYAGDKPDITQYYGSMKNS